MIRTAVLVALAAGSVGAQELNLRVTTGGRPTVARVYITDADGKAYRIPNTPGYSRRGEVHSIVDGSAAVRLPAGKYTLRAEKGSEFVPAQTAVDLAAGAAPRIELQLPRFHDMNRRGWYSGDLHIHRSPDEMPLLLRAEELNVGPVITRHVGGGRQPPPPFPQTALLRVSGTQLVTLQNQEVERLRKGHGAVLLLNTPEPVDPSMSDLFPLDLDFCRRAQAQSGFVDAEKPIWKNVPVNLAFGVVDSIGVVNNHFHPRDVLLDAETYGSMERDDPAYQTARGFAQWMIDLYYSFLNCGLRLPVSAGSASGIMASWPGYERVYVKLSGPFGSQQWFQDLKAGRSIATNGPLLEVSVNGEPPGTEWQWEKAATARVAIEARTQAQLESVEIVFNGEVMRAFHPNSGTCEATVDLKVPAPGWLAVRCFEPVTTTVRYAHTSPFYFTRNGKLPVKKSDAQRWASYINRLAAALQPADYPSPEAYRQVEAALKQAETFYRKLAGNDSP